MTTNVSVLHDGRVNCWSLMIMMEVSAYLTLVESAYAKRGGLKHQRESLKTTSGKRIRARMIDDIKRGAVLPPLVLGVVVPESDLLAIGQQSPAYLEKNVTTAWKDSISIIDGMQRTTALKDAVEGDAAVGVRSVRVECWISSKTDSLIYRMLVLNTGQVPWNLKRQLQVVYSPLIDELAKQITFDRLLDMEKGERRYKGGEFSPDSLIEAYLAFGLRKTEIDTQESLAEEFSRLDMAEAISAQKYSKFFYPVVQILVNVDRAFSRLDEPDATGSVGETTKFQIGRNIFDSVPARIGFVVACSIFVLGRLGNDKPEGDSTSILARVQAGSQKLIDRLNGLSKDELREFLGLEVLSERLAAERRRGGIGRYERAYFEAAFRALLEEDFEVPSLEVCWRTP